MFDRIVESLGGGPLVIVVARFLPGGRTATTFAAGAVEMDWREGTRVKAVLRAT